jgi:hypothetical protein
MSRAETVAYGSERSAPGIEMPAIEIGAVGSTADCRSTVRLARDARLPLGLAIDLRPTLDVRVRRNDRPRRLPEARWMSLLRTRRSPGRRILDRNRPFGTDPDVE